MKRWILFFYLVACVLLPPPVLAEPIKLRLVSLTPLSGAWSSYGKLVNDGIELAVEELRKESGTQIEVHYQDACRPTETVSALRSALQFGRVDAIVGSYCVWGLESIIPELNQRKILTFHTSVLPQVLLDRGDFLFSTNVAIKDEAEKMAEYAHNVLHAKTAAMFTLLTPWGEGFKESFAARFKALGGKIVLSESTPPDQNEFRSELTKLKGRTPDVLFAAHVSQTLGLLIRQTRELKINSQILTVDEAEEQSVIDQAGKTAEGMLLFSPEPSGPAYTRFQARFEKRFGYAPHLLGANAYDATKIAVAAAVDCNRDSGCIQAKISALKNYPGVSGQFSISPTGAAKKELVLKTVSNARKFENASPRHSAKTF